MEKVEIIDKLRESLPETIAGIGYGSGFYHQKGYDKEEVADKDIILIVNNLYRFLSEDYHLNPEHFYNGASRKYKKIEDKNPKFFYHKIACLKFNEGKYNFKLMIIEKNALLYDIMTWKHFGMAARMSKPIVYGPLPDYLSKALLYNRDNILITALLSLPDDEITKKELYQTIANLSYIGDWRMITHSEKMTKTEDIVDGAFLEFENMYGNNPLLSLGHDENHFNNCHPTDLIQILPDCLKQYIIQKIDVNKINSKDDLKKLKQIINSYFFKTNLKNTPLLMYSSYKSLGVKKTLNHFILKRKKAKKK